MENECIINKLLSETAVLMHSSRWVKILNNNNNNNNNKIITII